MARPARVALCLAAWAVAAWAETPPDAVEALLPNPVLESGQRWAFDGFSVVPPAGIGWISLAKTRERAAFAHGGERGEDAHFATVVAVRMDVPLATREAFLAAMRARRAAQVDPKRVESVRHEEALDAGGEAWCTRYRITGTEVTPWYAASRAIEVIGRTCRHPQLASLAVDINYALRGTSDASERVAREVGEAFVNGLQFVAPPGAAPQSLQQAVAAAESGDPGIAVRLGAMYEGGQGVAADGVAAEKWYRLAAAQGEVDALYNLGVLYERGIGRSRDPAEALRWFRRAADQRDAQAQLNLGLMHYKGDGVERNPKLARGWLYLSANNGNARARALLDQLKFEE